MSASDKSSKEAAQKVKAIRLAMGLTQEQFAAKLGVTFPTINRWENSKVRPSPPALMQLEKLEAALKKQGIDIS